MRTSHLQKASNHPRQWRRDARCRSVVPMARHEGRDILEQEELGSQLLEYIQKRID